MDILKWLQNIADRAPPDDVDEYLRCHHADTEQDVTRQAQRDHTIPRHRNRRKRRKLSSETLSQDQNLRRCHVSMNCSPSRKRRTDLVPSSSGFSMCDEDLYCEQAIPNNAYERRMRHKTRSERYEPKSKKHKKTIEHSGRRTSKPRQRKPQRTGDILRTSRFVQNSKFKDGPKEGRLTLRPYLGAGIFKHGRASAPVNASGTGLPDLVFNEMKFLQRPKEHQDEAVPDQAAGQQTRKTRKQLQEEEISTFFAKAPAENRCNTGMRDVQSTGQCVDSLSKETSLGQRLTNVRSSHSSQAKLGSLREVLTAGMKRQGTVTGKPREHSNTLPYTWSRSSPVLSLPTTERKTQSRGHESRQSSHVSDVSLPSLPSARKTIVQEPEGKGQSSLSPRVDKTSVIVRESLSGARLSTSIGASEGQQKNVLHRGDVQASVEGNRLAIETFRTSDVLNVRQRCPSNVHSPRFSDFHSRLGHSTRGISVSTPMVSREHPQFPPQTLTKGAQISTGPGLMEIPFLDSPRNKRDLSTRLSARSSVEFPERGSNDSNDFCTAKRVPLSTNELRTRDDARDRHPSFLQYAVLPDLGRTFGVDIGSTYSPNKTTTLFGRGTRHSDKFVGWRKWNEYQTEAIAHFDDVHELAAANTGGFSNSGKRSTVDHARDRSTQREASVYEESPIGGPPQTQHITDTGGLLNFWRPHMLY